MFQTVAPRLRGGRAAVVPRSDDEGPEGGGAKAAGDGVQVRIRVYLGTKKYLYSTKKSCL